MRFGELAKLIRRIGIKNAATGDDHRTLGTPDHVGNTLCLDLIGRGAADAPQFFVEKLFRIVIGLGLCVLAEGQCHRSGLRGIGHHLHGAGQGGQQVFGAGDAVEITADGAEAVVGGDRAVAEILNLLQHRVGAAGGEDVAWDQQHRECGSRAPMRRR